MRLKSVIWSTFFLLLGIIFGVIIHFLITLRSADEHQSYVAFQHTITPNHGKPFLLGFTSLDAKPLLQSLKLMEKYRHGLMALLYRLDLENLKSMKVRRSTGLMALP